MVEFDYGDTVALVGDPDVPHEIVGWARPSSRTFAVIKVITNDDNAPLDGVRIVEPSELILLKYRGMRAEIEECERENSELERETAEKADGTAAKPVKAPDGDERERTALEAQQKASNAGAVIGCFYESKGEQYRLEAIKTGNDGIEYVMLDGSLGTSTLSQAEFDECEFVGWEWRR